MEASNTLENETKQAMAAQYEYDGSRLARGMFRLGFRSLVPFEMQLDGDWSEEIGLFVANEHGVFARNSAPTVQTWRIECSILIGIDDPFAKEEVATEVQLSEPFTAAGRCKVRIKIPKDPFLKAGCTYEFVFRVSGNERPVSPVIPPHPIRLVPNTSPASKEAEKEDWLSCCRLVIPNIAWRAPPRLIIGEAASSLGIGGKIWDGSLAMIEFLFAEKDRWTRDLDLPDHKGCKIVDLGSGTGILGFGLALLKPECVVVNTDLPEVVPLLEMNIKKNNLSSKNCFAEAYSWGDDPKPSGLLDNVDIVTMCDVVYDSTCYRGLVDSLVKLKARHVLMSHRHRNRSEVEFFEELARIGDIECVKLPIIADDDPYQKILANIPTSTAFVWKERFQSTVDDVAVFRIRIR